MALYLGVIACFRTMETDFWSSRIKLDSFQIDEMRGFFGHPAGQAVEDKCVFGFHRVTEHKIAFIKMSSHKILFTLPLKSKNLKKGKFFSLINEQFSD